MYLEVFDRASGNYVRNYQMKGISVADLKIKMEIDPETEQYGCDIASENLSMLEGYVDEQIERKSSLSFQIDFYSE